MKTLDQIVDQLLAAESLAARSRLLVIGALAVWLSVSALALIAGDAGHFSRAGAVGTGLVLAAFAVTTSARQSYQTYLTKGLVLALRSNLRDIEGRPLMLRDAKPEDPEIAARDFDHQLEAVGRLFARLDRRATQARVTEVASVFVSTLQWGYGDLMLNRLHCGAWTCPS
ncbi:hypothetical protein [Stagnihabitans tardus]|uniref:Uncharacterized protein n=1 Tax=Stagnihabitans tardus TaxID=2699202 RepID=A0AAE4YDH7_9RHOB|nr:hypothetical protein [Stagnihabitans tardus]NBZ87600.1 hypothetical protein [Stagnihabitans tardus]